nr:retrovirus-related Pol polyprotein from transposon TNT 1-94 [Tanacetum cinerariifolium]
DFVVVDFEPDPRVPLILWRCFLKIGRALIDAHKGELTLRIENESITYNLDQTVRYSANYNQMTADKIDVIEMTCEEYSQEVLGFSDVTTSGNPTPHDDQIVSTTSPTLTPFGDSDFLLFEEADDFLGLEDDPDSSKINPFYYDPEGDILLLETILNRSIFTSVYAADQKLNKAYKVYKAGKRLLYVKRNKEISLGKDDQMNSVINCLTVKSTWDDLILYHERPSDVKESRVMDLKLCYNTFKFKECETLTQTFTRYKDLMNELVNDDIKLSKLEINIGFINRLPKKWLAFCQSLRNTNHVKESKLTSLFGKIKYKENLTDNIYETNKEKTLVSATPPSTAFFSNSIIQDFQDSPDDEEDTRSSQEYMNDLEEEFQERAFLAKSERFFKGSNSSSDKNKGLIAETYKRDEEKVSSDDNEGIKVKALMEFANEERIFVGKESVSNGEWVKISIQKYINEQIPTQKKKILGIDQLTKHTSTSGPKDLVFVKSSADNSNMSITSGNKHRLSKAKDFTLPNHDTSKVLPVESQRNTTDPSTIVTDSLATDYNSVDKSSVCSTSLPLQETLAGAKPVMFCKKCKIIDHITCDHAEFMSSIKTTQHLTGQGKSSSRSRPFRTAIPFLPTYIVGTMIINLMIVYTILYVSYVEVMIMILIVITDHNDIEWFRRRKALLAKKARANKTVSSNVQRSKTPTQRKQERKLVLRIKIIVDCLVVSLACRKGKWYSGGQLGRMNAINYYDL